MVNEFVDDETVYLLTKTLWENIAKVHSSSAALSLIELENTISGISAELHPGAARYYREVGLIK